MVLKFFCLFVSAMDLLSGLRTATDHLLGLRSATDQLLGLRLATDHHSGLRTATDHLSGLRTATDHLSSLRTATDHHSGLRTAIYRTQQMLRYFLMEPIHLLVYGPQVKNHWYRGSKADPSLSDGIVFR